MLNKVMLIGRCGNEPELKQSAAGKVYCPIRLAVDSSYIDRNTNQRVENVDWISVYTFARKAEVIAQYLHKGSLVFVEGKLQTSSYDDQTGRKVYTMKVIADSVQFLERKRDATPTAQPTQNYIPQPQYQRQEISHQPRAQDRSLEQNGGMVEEVPF